ncbi:MAG: acyl carrier protein, partial [Planctomycetaceae bacterium]
SLGTPHSAPGPQHSNGKADTGEDLAGFLINFVVEQTGYPPEMVEMDADLEADLGIDSIKKAQLFGELAEHFAVRLSDDDSLSLDDFPTLGHVAAFLKDKPRRHCHV